jgi:CheY-like chemotaxis protein
MPKRILLADDSITIQKVVELTFSDGDYEVTAVNNGAKAIQKLSEMRPDIILSDIIMPEKNGYEVCEYVKSHPEFRSIPVVLLTGTFEPFDPDRAEKAGSDAVVTKPFESQSLIQRVEELIEQSRSAAPAPSAPAGDPFAETSAFSVAPEVESSGAFTHDADIFGGGSSPSQTTEMPFDEAPSPAFGGETRAFPRMSFDEMQSLAQPPAPPAAAPAEPSPWDEPAAAGATGGETRAFPSMKFEDLQKMAAETPAAPWDDTAPTTPPAAEPSPWDEAPAASATGGETRAFPRMSFDDLQKMAAETPAPPATPFAEEPAHPAAAEPAPWDEPAAAGTGGETRAFPRMSFDDLQKMAAETPAQSTWSPAEEPPPEPEIFAPTAPAPFVQEPFEPEPEAAAPAAEPWASSEPEPEPEPLPAAGAHLTADDYSPPVNPQITDDSLSAPVNPQITDVNPQITDLTDDQVERIARRVVEIMSEQVVKNIAWEVIPDLAEMVVKERIRQLEAEG